MMTLMTTYLSWFDPRPIEAAFQTGAVRFAEKFDRRPDLAYVAPGVLDANLQMLADQEQVEIYEHPGVLPGHVHYLVSEEL